MPPPPKHTRTQNTPRIDPPNLDLYRARVALAFNECQRVGVLRTLAPLGTCDTLPASDKEVLKAICPALYRPAPPQTGASPGGGAAAGAGTSGSAGETGAEVSHLHVHDMLLRDFMEKGMRGV